MKPCPIGGGRARAVVDERKREVGRPVNFGAGGKIRLELVMAANAERRTITRKDSTMETVSSRRTFIRRAWNVVQFDDDVTSR